MKNKIQSKVAKAFDKKLGDAVDSFTCSKEIQSGEFDFATQTYPVIVVEVYTGRGVLFGSYLKDMVKPTDYQVTDCKAIVLQNEVTQVPQISDVWSTSKGRFKLVNIGQDPVGATYTAQLRKVGA
ncbi:glutamate 5-kinase [Acinetobacter sp.]|uniref:glutamate 5-kinase n=1 Tax=Acinetobacter sp. TaxID=472 RepID=UPI0026473F42|nr:glutamate 5-kinase [Acinetobacter sp.]MDN5511154.1 glutamate 5-kinase [Acinetobacter sp.]MDN5523953.1 glutamate 5-kinase [Acinetobacter sp.]